jgi:hypothetical protein
MTRIFRTCIICGEHANSREHVFPASLGGRTVNKGIYCASHNNSFSPMVAVLAEQMRIFNALMAVRHDRESSAKAFVYSGKDGKEVKIFDGAINRIAGPYSGETIQLSLSFGGPEGLKAIGYVALTFLAHCHPDLARLSGTTELKNVLTTSAENESVWWEKQAALQNSPVNPFVFGHTIALQEDASTGKITAIVSMFQSLHFAVQLGNGQIKKDHTTLVFVDPLAHSPPNDIQIQYVDRVLFVIQKPEPLQSSLIQMVQGGNTNQFQDLMTRIERWAFDNETRGNLQELNTLRGQSAQQIVYGTKAVVEQNFLRVYRLMKYIADDSKIKLSGKPHGAIITRLFYEAVACTQEDDSILTSFAADCLERSMVAVVGELANRLVRLELSRDDLFEVFSSGIGAAVVGNGMMEAISDRLYGAVA